MRVCLRRAIESLAASARGPHVCGVRGGPNSHARGVGESSTWPGTDSRRNGWSLSEAKALHDSELESANAKRAALAATPEVK